MKKSIELGLAISAIHSTPGVPKTAQEIANYCDCSRQRIQQIEERALRKVRAHLHCNKELREELAMLFGLK